MNPPPPEFMALIMRMIACHSKLDDAIKNKDREEALEATKEAAVLNMGFLNIIPNLNKLGIKIPTTEEIAQLKKNLSALLN